MKLDLHKNITASITLDNNKLMDHDNSMVYGKVEEDDVFLFVKDPRNGRTLKIVLRQYAEEVRDEKDI
tara:strand:- start:245 stop:448 length:204 start_codon:yes stop_codon:yes gene_type:complete